LWVYATVLSVFAAFVIIVRHQFRRFSVLATYFAIVAAVSLLRMHVLNAYGFQSSEYAYFYYFSDLLPCVLLYFVVATLYRKVFPAKRAHLRVRVGSILIAAGVGIWSLAIAQTASSRLMSRWIFEYSQDLYFVSAIAALILFGFARYKPNVPKPVQPTRIRVCGVLSFSCIDVHDPISLASLGRSSRWVSGFLRNVAALGVAYVFCDPNISESLDDPYPPL